MGCARFENTGKRAESECDRVPPFSIRSPFVRFLTNSDRKYNGNAERRTGDVPATVTAGVTPEFSGRKNGWIS